MSLEAPIVAPSAPPRWEILRAKLDSRVYSRLEAEADRCGITVTALARVLLVEALDRRAAARTGSAERMEAAS